MLVELPSIVTLKLLFEKSPILITSSEMSFGSYMAGLHK